MDKWDIKDWVFRRITPDFACQRKVLRRIVERRNQLQRYDRAFAKGVRDTQKMLYSLVFGSVLLGGCMVMFYTRYIYVNGVLLGGVKMLGFWMSGWMMADVVQVKVVMKHHRDRVVELAAKYSIDGDA